MKQPSRDNKPRGLGRLYIACSLIMFYIVLYDWGVFEADILRMPVAVAKLAVPIILLVLIPVKRPPLKAFRIFIIFYLLFMLWAMVPGIIAGEFQFTALTWLKYLPRFLFALLVGIYFLKTPLAAVKVMKVFVLVGVFAVLQFCILIPMVLFDFVDGIYLPGVRGVYFGPLGILGNQAAIMSFTGLSFPVFRLTGFWLEPTNASGFLFAAFFLGRLLWLHEKKLFWRVMSYTCLAGGFLCLSNAGYLAIAVPLFFASLFMKKSGGKMVYVVLLAGLAFGLAFFALRGRALITEQYSGSAELRALAGARAGAEFDPYGGRLDLLQKNIGLVMSNPFGIGMKVSGEGVEGSYEEASASAPILWLAYTGFMGLFLLLLRDYQVLIIAIRHSRESPLIMAAAQAWLAMFVQHLAYGTWMTPAYLVLCALVATTVFHCRVPSDVQPSVARNDRGIRVRAASIRQPRQPALTA